MDTFLQLDADVYDDDLVVGEPVELEIQIQRPIVETSPTEELFSDPLYRSVGSEEQVEQLTTPKSNEQERQHYLRRILAIERGMQKADKEVQQRIDAMKRILELKDPMEQLAEYLTLKQEARRDDDVNIVEDLLHCATRMTKKEDSEVATLGAFFFLCDGQRPKARGLTGMLPVVAAMMEASSELDHPPF